MRGLYFRACLAAVIALSACARPLPPTGKWEGVYEDEGLIVAVRLEIDPGGSVRVSAPNALTKDGTLSKTQRADILSDLAGRLEAGWDTIKPLALEFDGKAFRKPGGVAPQLEWDNRERQMTMIYYSGSRASVRVKLTQVDAFGRS